MRAEAAAREVRSAKCEAPRANSLRRALIPAALVALLCVPVFGQLRPVPEDEGVTGLGLALRKLGTIGSVLYVTAHPDDENNAVLVRVSRGQGLRTRLLTLTRGDGGQNEIGPELFQAIGILRSEELLAVHRYDGAEQYFSQAYEFGYSFSVQESFDKWGKEETLGDIVRVIRTFRPHVMLTLSPQGEGGGQHHQASAILAAEAFRAAADPARFPAQIRREGLRPWQPLRLFQSSSRRRRGGEATPTYDVDVGRYDPLLGESWAEYGIRARTNHRCQGMNALAQPGERASSYRLADAAVESPKEADDFFVGLDVSLRSLRRYDPDLEALLTQAETWIAAAREAYRRSDYSAVAEAAASALSAVRRARSQADDPDAIHFLLEEENDLEEAVAKAHFIQFQAYADKTEDGKVVPGESFEVDARLFDNSQGRAIEDPRLGITAPDGWTVESVSDEPGRLRVRVTVAADAELSRPYWYRSDPSIDRYAVRGPYHGYEPFAAPPLTAEAVFRSGSEEIRMRMPVQFRWFDADSAKDRRMEVKVVPALSVTVEPEHAVSVASSPASELKVAVVNDRPDETRAELTVEAPPGWTVEPRTVPLVFRRENESLTTKVRVTPPPGTPLGDYPVRAVATSAEKEYREGYQTIAYHHIQTRLLYHPAQATVSVLDLRLPEALRVGYVMGVGDEVGLATERLGAAVQYLESDDLATGDLSRFDVIVLGVRAYLNREDLKANNRRLLDYVENGGHLVVQYNKYEFNQAQYPPYPAGIGRPPDRVSVEEAPVTVLAPDHPLFRFPNRIGPQDWEHWVQERGTYMLGEWDGHFQPLIEMEDPWAYNPGKKLGGLVLAHYGKGTYLYVGLVMFRELPEGVHGAYRLWANILSLGRAKP